MIKTTTPNEIILHVYQESSSVEQEKFKIECLIQPTLADERDELSEIKMMLKDIAINPKKSSIENILNYSATIMKVC